MRHAHRAWLPVVALVFTPVMSGCTPAPRPAIIDRIPIARVVKDSGLIIEDLSIGDGPMCLSPDWTVTVVATSITGEVDGERVTIAPDPAETTFPLRRAARGLREGIPGTNIGGVRRLTIPAWMAHPDRSGLPIPKAGDVTIEFRLIEMRP